MFYVTAPTFKEWSGFEVKLQDESKYFCQKIHTVLNNKPLIEFSLWPRLHIYQAADYKICTWQAFWEEIHLQKIATASVQEVNFFFIWWIYGISELCSEFPYELQLIKYLWEMPKWEKGFLPVMDGEKRRKSGESVT